MTPSDVKVVVFTVYKKESIRECLAMIARKKKNHIKNSTLVNTERKEGELVRGNSFGGWYKEWRERAAVPALVLWNVGKRERERERENC